MTAPGRNLYWVELPWQDVLAKLEALAQGKPSGAATAFLDHHQWAPLASDPRLTIAGGYATAQHRRVGLGCTPSLRYFRVERSVLPPGVNSARTLRSFLYRSGLPDGAAGDIIFGEYIALIVEEDVELLELGLTATRMPSWQPPAVVVQRVTAAGNRIDAVIAGVFKVSRAEAQTALKFGFVFNGLHAVSKQTQPVVAGMQLVYRTKGRVEIVAMDDKTKSGRLWVEYRSFPQ